MSSLTVGHEVGYLAIAVASDVLESGVACRTLVETLYRHYREQLVDGPCVGQRLEYRDIAEILVGKQLVQSTQLIGSMLQCLSHAVHLTANAPIHTLNLGTCTQVDNAMRE